jgi:hypothetical protein
MACRVDSKSKTDTSQTFCHDETGTKFEGQDAVTAQAGTVMRFSFSMET